MKTMKRRLLMVVAMMATVVSSWSQGLTATLQQGGRMTPYYGVDAFKQAYEAASNGAIITLSAGSFNSVGEITKQITIIGNGGFSAIEKRTYINGIYDSTNKYSWYLKINANNVKIEGIYFSSYRLILGNISNLKISHCYISDLRAEGTHTNTIIDQCYIEDDYTMNKSENYCIKNSFISNFLTRNSSSNMAYITNCRILRYSYYHYGGANSGDPFKNISYPYAVYKNCILGEYTYSSQYLTETSSSYWNGYDLRISSYPEIEYYNCVFFYYPYSWNGTYYTYVSDLATKELYSNPPSGTNRKDNSKSTWADLFDTTYSYYGSGYIKTELKGDDGKQVGPYGGSGFTMIPSIPRITDSTIDSYTDSSGKIKVKIKVESNQ